MILRRRAGPHSPGLSCDGHGPGRDHAPAGATHLDQGGLPLLRRSRRPDRRHAAAAGRRAPLDLGAAFLHALNYCMLLPGPEATQLAAYIGWLMHRWRGGLAAGVIFVLPGFLSILLLSMVYAGWGDVPLVESALLRDQAGGPRYCRPCAGADRAAGVGQRLSARIAAAAFVGIFAFGSLSRRSSWPPPLAGWIGGRLGVEALISPALPGAGDPPEPEPVPPPPVHRTAATAALWLALWWVPVGFLGRDGRRQRLLRRGGVLLEDRLGHFRGRIRRPGVRRATRGGRLRLAAPGRDAGRPGDGRDHAGTAHPGGSVRRLPGAYRDPGNLLPIVAGALGPLVTTWVTYVPCFLFIFLGRPTSSTCAGARR